MIIEVVGVKKVSFSGNDGNKIEGMNLYYTAAGQSGVEGLETGKIFISNQKFHDLGITKIEAGSYELFYNRYGKVDSLKQI